MLFRSMFLVLVLLTSLGCVTKDEQQVKAPTITSATPIPEAIDLAIDYGGETLNQTLKLIHQQRAYKQASKYTSDRILAGVDSMKSSELINTVKIYRETVSELDRRIFVKLIFSELNLAKQLGWQLAATLPSPVTGKYVDDALSLILAEGQEGAHFIPQMAQAVAANSLGSAYGVVVRGLMQTGDDSFAKAMIALNPSRASADFLNYLALAPLEDLRQLNQQSVNVMTCFVILNHMHALHPPLDHPRYEYLFYYAISRNQGMAELARSLLESGYEKDRARLAFTLARLPAWIQVAFVESVRRNLTPNARGFLAELRKLTVQDDVLEELKDISL